MKFGKAVLVGLFLFMVYSFVQLLESIKALVSANYAAIQLEDSMGSFFVTRVLFSEFYSNVIYLITALVIVLILFPEIKTLINYIKKEMI